jgi:hypothetical protein
MGNTGHPILGYLKPGKIHVHDKEIENKYMNNGF